MLMLISSSLLCKYLQEYFLNSPYFGFLFRCPRYSTAPTASPPLSPTHQLWRFPRRKKRRRWGLRRCNTSACFYLSLLKLLREDGLMLYANVQIISNFLRLRILTPIILFEHLWPFSQLLCFTSKMLLKNIMRQRLLCGLLVLYILSHVCRRPACPSYVLHC